MGGQPSGLLCFENKLAAVGQVAVAQAAQATAAAK